MKRIILNLDWGSFYLKGCARLQGRPGLGQAIQILGKLDKKDLVAQKTIQLPGDQSLKAGFLTGKISSGGLANHRLKAVELLSKCFVKPLAAKVREWSAEPVSFRVNVHTPLQLMDQVMILGSGVFDLFDPSERLLVPTYRTDSEWNDRMNHPAQPAENRWAHWLMERLEEAFQQEGLGEDGRQYCYIPESLTCVQDLVGPMEFNESRQFLVMDVGHFTTDYAIVAFHRDRTERMIVRRADSIFDAGFQFIEAHGPRAWTEKVMHILNTYARADHPTQGIHGYTDLALVLVGGGAAGLQKGSREILRECVETWALRQELFRESLKGGRRKVFLASPPHLTGAFQLLGRPLVTHQLEAVSTELHIPCVLACGLADARTGLRVSGDRSLLVLEKEWERHKIGSISSEPQRDKGQTPPPSPRKGPAPSISKVATKVAAPQSPRAQAEKLFESAMAKDANGQHHLPLFERRTMLIQASRLGYRPAILGLALLQIRSGSYAEEVLGHRTLNALSHGGDHEALFHLGKLHVKGQFQSLPSNPMKGLTLLLKAARASHLSAMKLVADCYEKGIGTTASIRCAEEWRVKALRASHKGDSPAIK